MKNDPLEKQIEKRVCEFAHSLGVLTYKFTSPARRAVPDRLFITPNGHVCFVEFKRKGEVPTPSQSVEIAKIRAHGVKVFVVDTVADGRNVVSAMVDAMRDPMF